MRCLKNAAFARHEDEVNESQTDMRNHTKRIAEDNRDAMHNKKH